MRLQYLLQLGSKYLYTYKIYLYTYKWVYMRFIHLLLSNLIGQNLQPWYNTIKIPVLKFPCIMATEVPLILAVA